MLANWKKEAESHDMSLSRFLVELIDDAMRRNPMGISPKKELEARLDQAMKELATESQEKETLKHLLAKSEKSLADYRDALNTVVESSGDEQLQRSLIGLFHHRVTWKVVEIPPALGLSATNADDMKRLANVIDQLKNLGVIDGDFETVRCRIGAKKKISKCSIIAAKNARRHKRISRGLRSSEDDEGDSPFVPLDAP